MRLRYLPQFRQTRRVPVLSGNSRYRFFANKLNPLDFEGLFSGPDVTDLPVVDGVERKARVRWLPVFVPPVGEKFP